MISVKGQSIRAISWWVRTLTTGRWPLLMKVTSCMTITKNRLTLSTIKSSTRWALPLKVITKMTMKSAILCRLSYLLQLKKKMNRRGLRASNMLRPQLSNLSAMTTLKTLSLLKISSLPWLPRGYNFKRKAAEMTTWKKHMTSLRFSKKTMKAWLRTILSFSRTTATNSLLAV